MFKFRYYRKIFNVRNSSEGNYTIDSVACYKYKSNKFIMSCMCNGNNSDSTVYNLDLKAQFLFFLWPLCCLFFD